MPKITDLQIQKRHKDRVSLYVDGEFFCGMQAFTVLKLALKIGKEISSAELMNAVTDSEKEVAFSKAIDMLSRSSKTEKKMREYLLGKEFSSTVTEYVIDKLKNYGYIDDRRYAELFATQNGSVKGERRIKAELILKGVSKETAEEFCVTDAEEALSNASALAEKYMRNKTSDRKTVEKLYRFLIGRGYGYDTVNRVLANYKNFEEAED